VPAIVNNPDTKPRDGLNRIVNSRSRRVTERMAGAAEQGFQLRVHHLPRSLVEEAESGGISPQHDPQYVALWPRPRTRISWRRGSNALIRRPDRASRKSTCATRKRDSARGFGGWGHRPLCDCRDSERAELEPLVYRTGLPLDTVITRSLKEDLRLSRIYARGYSAL